MKERRFRLSVIGSLALGVGVCAAVLGLVDAVPLPPAGDEAAVVSTSPATAPWGGGWGAEAVPPAAVIEDALRPLGLLLAGLALLGAATAAAHVALSVLDRLFGSRHEYALRRAVGASRRVVRRQLLVEAARLGALAGLAALAAAATTLGVMAIGWPAGLAVEGLAGEGSAIDPSVAVTLALRVALLATVASIACCVLPVVAGLRAAGRKGDRLRVAEWLDIGRGWRLRRALTVGQIGIALVLLVAAGLVLRSDPTRRVPETVRFDARDTLTLQIALEGSAAADRASTLMELMRRVERLPEVRAASIGSPGAWLGIGVVDRHKTKCVACLHGTLPAPVVTGRVDHHAVGPGFFERLGVRVEEGREFTTRDRSGTPLAAVVNRSFVGRFLGGAPAVGLEIQVADRGWREPWYRIVGVVEDVGPVGLGWRGGAVPALYVALLQQPVGPVTLAARTRGPPLEQAPAVAASVRAAASGASIGRISTLENDLAAHLQPPRRIGQAAACLAILATLLAAYGAYATTRHLLVVRRSEIGIHRAVGARAGQVLQRLGLETCRLATLGIGVGGLGVTALGHGAPGIFAGVRPFDPVVLGGAALTLLLAAAAGGISAAWRAARMAPVRLFDA